MTVLFLTKCRLPGSLYLVEDLLSFSPPDITLGIEIMLGKVLHDRVHQLAHAAEAAGQDRLLAKGISRLDLLQEIPGTGDGCVFGRSER